MQNQLHSWPRTRSRGFESSPCARAAFQSRVLKTQPHLFSDILKSAFLMTVPSHFFLSFHEFEGQRCYFSAQVLDISVSLPVLPSSRPEKVKSPLCFLHSGTPPVQHGPVSRRRSPLPLCPQPRARARWAARVGHRQVALLSSPAWSSAWERSAQISGFLLKRELV